MSFAFFLLVLSFCYYHHCFYYQCYYVMVTLMPFLIFILLVIYFFLTTCYFLYDAVTVFFVNIFNIFTRHSNIIDIITCLLLWYYYYGRGHFCYNYYLLSLLLLSVLFIILWSDLFICIVASFCFELFRKFFVCGEFLYSSNK